MGFYPFLGIIFSCFIVHLKRRDIEDKNRDIIKFFFHKCLFKPSLTSISIITLRYELLISINLIFTIRYIKTRKYKSKTHKKNMRNINKREKEK